MEQQAEYKITPDVGNEIETTDILKYQNGHLELAIRPTWEQAQYAVTHLDNVGRNIAFWMGDFLNFMEDLFPEEWSQLIPDIGWEEKTLMNYKWVAKAVHPDVREIRLSFSIHAVVAKLTPELQAVWLEMALEGGWSCARLTKELKGPPKEKEPKHRSLKVECPHCSEQFDLEIDV